MNSYIASFTEHDLVRINQITIEARLASILNFLDAIVLIASPITRFEGKFQTSLKLLPCDSLEVMFIESKFLRSLCQSELRVNQGIFETFYLGLQRAQGMLCLSQEGLSK